MPANEWGIDADPPLYAAVTTEVRSRDGAVIPAGTVVAVYLGSGIPWVHDPGTGIRAQVSLDLLDPDF